MARSLHLRENTNKRTVSPEIYTCYMTSQEHGGSLRYDFDPDPTKVLWTMSGGVQTKMTRGGQVAYSTGRQVGPLQIIGYCRSRWDLKELGDFIGLHMNEAVYLGAPLRFVYPERDVDYLIYIESVSPIGYDAEAGEISAYEITAQVTQDHSSLSQIEQSFLVDNPLLENVEWIDVQRALEIAEARFGSIVGVDPDIRGGDDAGGAPPDQEDTTKDDGRTNTSEDPDERLQGPGDRDEKANAPTARDRFRENSGLRDTPQGRFLDNLFS